MSVFSKKELDHLQRVEVEQIRHLLRLISRASVRDKQIIESNYREHGAHFAETLLFLQNLEWIRDRDGQIHFTNRGEAAAQCVSMEQEFRRQIVEAMTSENGPYMRALAVYLSHFDFTDEGLAHRPPLATRIEESSVRNFLMQLRLVTYRAFEDRFYLADDAVELYVWARNVRNSAAADVATTRIRQRTLAGQRAEAIALEYERARVGERWRDSVVHVSATAPFSCYDIRSVTIVAGSSRPRYIEVKSSSRSLLQFYWTASEIDAAQALREKYFLYLVLSDFDERLDETQIVMLSDPIATVYNNPEVWSVDRNVVLCTRKR